MVVEPAYQAGMSPLSTAALTTLAGMPESAPASGTVRVSLSRNGGSSIWLVMP